MAGSQAGHQTLQRVCLHQAVESGSAPVKTSKSALQDHQAERVCLQHAHLPGSAPVETYCCGCNCSVIAKLVRKAVQPLSSGAKVLFCNKVQR